MTGRRPASGSAGERHERVTELFLEACELAGSQRAEFLDDACGDDVELRREIEALLAADGHAVARVLLETPPALPVPAAEPGNAPSWAMSAGQLLEPDAPRRRAGAATWVVFAAAALVLVWLVPWPATKPQAPSQGALRESLARAAAARHAGQLDQAEAILRDSLGAQLTARGDMTPEVRDTALRLAELLETRGQSDEALELRRVVMSLTRVAGG